MHGISIMAHRNFLLVLLAATFMCIVVLQMSLDNWILGGTVHYIIGVEKKDQKDVPAKLTIPSPSSDEKLSRNSSFSSDVLQSESSSSVSTRSQLPKSASNTSGTLLQQEWLLESSRNSAKLESESPTFSNFLSLQRTHSNSSYVQPPQLVSTSFINAFLRQAATASPSNFPGRNSESIASNFSTQPRVLPTDSSVFAQPQSVSPSSNVSHLPESESVRLDGPASETTRETSTSKSIADVRPPSTTNPKRQLQQELRTSDKVEARIKVRSFEQRKKSRDILQRKQPQEFVSRQERLQEILKQSNSMHVRSRADPLRSLRPLPTVKPADVMHVILLTYFRSGSTFVGDLLQQNWKTFYHFEPLHFMTYDSRIGGNKLQEAFDLFNNILRCNFSNEENYLRWAKKPDNQFLFERNVFLWFSCKTSPRMCFTSEMVSAVCQRAPVQVMKITRLHMRDLKEFLSQNPDINTKVVFLTRDPRGIISSRKTLDWCSDTQCSDPQILCTEMEDDIRVFNELQLKDPERFIQVQYEDISLYPEKEAKSLFDFLGLPFSLSVRRFLKTHTTARKADNLNPYSTRRNSSSMAFSWRSRLNFPQVTSIQSVCSEVIHQLNHTLVTSPRELYSKDSAKNHSPDLKAVKASGDSPFQSGNYRHHFPANEAKVNSISNVQGFETSETSNYAERDVSTNSRRRMIASSSKDELKNVKDSLDSASAVHHLQSGMDSLRTYDHTIKSR